MAPLLPRFHFFEIDDQPWFPPFLRAHVQNILQQAWIARVPPLQRTSAARIAASLLHDKLGPSLSSQTYIDFCAGSGGPTPTIERFINRRLRDASLPPVDFVLTDLHPNPEAWARISAKSQHILYQPDPVDASNPSPTFLDHYAGRAGAQTQEQFSTAKKRANNSNGTSIVPRKQQKKIFRLFNLAFHHFDDPLARSILRNTLETSHGFAIFELQGRHAGSFATCLLLGIGLLLSAPYHAWRLRSWSFLVFTYLVPVLPFVVVFDGWVSCLRTRTPDEVRTLMKTCGASSVDWDVRSGSEVHLWPCGYLHWIIATKKSES
ncbi:hypothetical protein ACRALDRAFT_1067716 [Sodiomyces alcalophilus JCM 7366]|uniref:uncharacterized protein n=1 Tax=Sodiomyces alcalophilus JCM 7366 TaxID=591952 RepID=UPI0039B69077